MCITIGGKKFEAIFVKDGTGTKTKCNTHRQYRIKLVNGDKKLLAGSCDIFFDETKKAEFGVINRNIRFGYLANFYVSSKFRNNGLAKELLRRIIKDNPNCVIGLYACTVWDKVIPQSALVKLYEKMGFRQIGYYENDNTIPKMIIEA